VGDAPIKELIAEHHLRTSNCCSTLMSSLIRRSSPGMRGGVPLVIELFRRLGAVQIVTAQVRVKQRHRGLTAAPLVETLIAGQLGSDFVLRILLR
jgi:hypothetical protein